MNVFLFYAEKLILLHNNTENNFLNHSVSNYHKDDIFSLLTRPGCRLKFSQYVPCYGLYSHRLCNPVLFECNTAPSQRVCALSRSCLRRGPLFEHSKLACHVAEISLTVYYFFTNCLPFQHIETMQSKLLFNAWNVVPMVRIELDSLLCIPRVASDLMNNYVISFFVNRKNTRSVYSILAQAALLESKLTYTYIFTMKVYIKNG